MNESIQAVFEHGVFRPLEPIELTEQERVSLIVFPTTGDAANARLAHSALERQREALLRMRAAMEALPEQSHGDGLGGADHDQILYGG